MLCFACQQPLSPEQVADERYEQGVSCPFCIDSLSPERKASLRERVNQLQRARERGEFHIGDDSVQARRARTMRDASEPDNGGTGDGHDF